MAFYNTKMSPFVIPSSVSNITNPGVNWSINENHPNLYEKNGLIYSKNNENLFLYNGTNEYIDLEENVKVIQDYCFHKCDSLISINIPSNLDRIGIFAFWNCKQLKSLKINSVNFIEIFAFSSCAMLNIFEMSQCSNPGIFSNGCITGTSLTNIKLPNGLKILKYNSFAGNKNLESVYLPPTVTQIYDYTFNGCTNLTEIIIAPGSQLEYIGFLALNNTKIKTFHIINSISNITYLGINDWTVDSNHPYFIEKDGLLYSRNKEILWIYKGNIENVIIENDLKQINERCFYHCNTLKTVVGQNVELIGKQSFESCKNVTSINFKNVGIIGEDAFTSCSNLEYFSITNLKGMYYTDFNMPLRYCNNLKTISDFSSEYFCAYLDTLISINDSQVIAHASKSPVTEISIDCQSIHNYAFQYSENLETVYMKNVFKIGFETFKGCKQLKQLYVSDRLKQFAYLSSFPNKDIQFYVLYNNANVIKVLRSYSIPQEKIFRWYINTKEIKENRLLKVELQFMRVLFNPKHGSIIFSSFSS